MEWYWIAYLIINSFLLAYHLEGSLNSYKEVVIAWTVVMSIGLPLFIIGAIFYRIPKWNWFLDNVWFWILLWFTDRYKNLHPQQIEFLKKASDCKQTKAIVKKYGYEL